MEDVAAPVSILACTCNRPRLGTSTISHQPISILLLEFALRAFVDN
jgi:hypothetical protein